MNRVQYIQLRSIKILNRLLAILLAVLLLVSTRGNIGFLLMQSYYHVSDTKDKIIKKATESTSLFSDVELLNSNTLGDYSYFMYGMVDENFLCKLCGEKAKDATIIWNTCIEAGICPEAAAGIINNYLGEAHVWQYNGAMASVKSAVAWCHEQIDKFNAGEMTPEEFNATKYSGGRSTAFGAWQWLGKRKLDLAKSARNANADISSINFQINYVLCEMGLMDNLTDYEVRFGSERWKKYTGTASMTPKEYAIDFACYFEGYLGTTNLSDYADDSKDDNKNHTGKAQKIYEAFMAAAEKYAAEHRNDAAGGIGAAYNGSILTASFIKDHNIDTSKMTEARWEIVEHAYYWCDYGDKDYILYSMGTSSSINRDNATWKDYDRVVANKGKATVDCSHFVYCLYVMVGIKIQDTTDGNYENSNFKQIDPDDLVAGDIVAHRNSAGGHVQIFLGWKDPKDHSKGYWKAAAHTYKYAAPDEVSVKLDTKRVVEVGEGSGWRDGNYRAYRHKNLPVGNGVIMNPGVNSGAYTGEVLLIGDSRVEGMCNAKKIELSNFGNFTISNKFHAKKGSYNNMTIICCTSAGYNLLEDKDVAAKIDVALTNKIPIVIELGVNDLDYTRYKNKISTICKATNVYWCTIGPVTGKNTLQSNINSFNSQVKSNAASVGYKVLDYEAWVKEYSYENKMDSAGLHYDKDINKGLFEKLYSSFYK